MSGKNRSAAAAGLPPSPVPVNKPKTTTPVAASSAPANLSAPKVELPSDEETDVDTVALMRKIYEHNSIEIRRFILKCSKHFPGYADVPVHQLQPLKLPNDSAISDSELRSYKFPWDRQSAMHSLRQNNLFEVAGNLLWLKMFSNAGDEDVLAGGDVSWHKVVAACPLFASSTSLNGRILFPCVLPIYASTLEPFNADHFAGNLKMLYGRSLLYAWHLEMYRALNAASSTDQAQRVAKLMECALTASLQAYILTDPESVHLESIHSSERIKIADKVISDSFPAFCQKLKNTQFMSQKTIPGKVDWAAKRSITYNGSALNKNSVTAATSVLSCIDEEGMRCLAHIEQKYGKEILSHKYTNLHEICKLCEAEFKRQDDRHADQDQGESAADLVNVVLQHFCWALKYEKLRPQDICQSALGKGAKNNPGLVQKELLKRGLKIYLEKLVSDMEDATILAELRSVLLLFKDYQTFDHIFGCSEKTSKPHGSGASTSAVEGNEEPQEEASEDPLEKQKQGKSRAAVALLFFLFDVFSDKYEAEIAALWEASQKQKVTNLCLLNWQELKDDAGKAMKEIDRLLGMHKQLVSASTCQAPALSSRTLAKLQSNPDDPEPRRREEIHAERNSTWQQAQAMRKKVAVVGVCKAMSAKALQDYFEKCDKAFKFDGKAGQSHRLFVFSADCFWDASTTPWKTIVPWKESEGKAILDFMTQQRGPADCSLCFDGRSKECRRAMDQHMENMRNSFELWVVYKPCKRLGSRKVCWTENNRETGWMSLPAARTAFEVKAVSMNKVLVQLLVNLQSQGFAPSLCFEFSQIPLELGGGTYPGLPAPSLNPRNYGRFCFFSRIGFVLFVMFVFQHHVL